MGSLSFETNIRIKGTKNDKMQILSVLKEYEAGKKGIEFPDFRLQTTTNRAKLGDLDDVELRDFVDNDEELKVSTVWGPYGKYSNLNDIDIFRDMSEAAPDAFFEAEITGGTSYTRESLKAVLENQKLKIVTFFEANEEESEAYLEYITKKLPYKAFLKLFKLSGDLLDEDIYIDVMNDIATETWDKNSLFDMEYDDFIETLGAFDVEIDLEEEDYQTAVEKINKLEIEGGGLYADKYTGGFSETLIYDSIAKAYIDRK